MSVQNLKSIKKKQKETYAAVIMEQTADMRFGDKYSGVTGFWMTVKPNEKTSICRQ